MRQPIQVLIYPVGFTDNDWEYLLLRRVESRGGFWQGVSGGVEEGEDIMAAARRELWEETGFTPSRIEPIDYVYSFLLAEEWRHLYSPDVTEIIEHVFVAYLAGRPEPQIDPQEHDEARWCPFEQALAHLVWPGNVEALKRCQRLLSARSDQM